MKTKLLVVLLVVIFSCSKNETPEPEPVNGMYFPAINSDVWETKSPEALGWNTAAIPQLRTLLKDNGTRAFIVLVDGNIVIEEYFGNTIIGNNAFNKTSLWYWASAGKTLTSFIVGKAQEDGFLKITDKSSDYLGKSWTSCTQIQESAITIRHQLTMTTGLDDDVANNHSFEAKDLKYKAAAGSRWAYHNAPYTIIDNVIEKATKQKFENYFDSSLSSQIGMDGYWQWIGNDHIYFSTARSMARFGLLILNNGNWENEIIMKDKVFFEEMKNTSQNINKSYGYLWWLNGKESFRVPESQLQFPGSITPAGPNDMFSGIGKNGQYVSIIPSKRMVLVRMGENPETVLVPFMFLNDIWLSLNKIIK